MAGGLKTFRLSLEVLACDRSLRLSMINKSPCICLDQGSSDSADQAHRDTAELTYLHLRTDQCIPAENM